MVKTWHEKRFSQINLLTDEQYDSQKGFIQIQNYQTDLWEK